MNAKISLKIRQLQFVLCALIVIMHSMGNSGLSTGIQMIEKYVGFGICQLAVPAFFIISSYLFWFNCNNKDVLKRKVKSRIRTLLVPYLFWNVVWELYYYYLSKIGLSGKSIEGYSASNFITNVLSSTNTALWFVKWLIVFMILSPLLYKVYKVINLKTFIILEIFSIGIVILFGFTYYSFIYWLPVYLLGLFLGAKYEELVNWINKNSNSIPIICISFVFVSSLCVLAAYFENYYLNLVLRYMGATGFILGFMCLPDCKLNLDIFYYTYPIYCVHVPVCGALKHALHGFLGFVFIPLITVLVIFFVFHTIKLKTPRLYCFMFGKI